MEEAEIQVRHITGIVSSAVSGEGDRRRPETRDEGREKGIRGCKGKPTPFSESEGTLRGEWNVVSDGFFRSH